MPYIRIATSIELNDAKKSELLEAVAPLIAILPGKNRDNAMVEIDDGKFMALGDPSLPCVFVEVRLYRESPAEAKAEFAAELNKVLAKCFNLPPKHFYLNYMEMDHWGVDGRVV